MRKPLLLLLPLGLVCAFASNACLYSKECVGGENGDCTGPASRDVCIGGEGSYSWYSKPCDADEKCVQEPGGRGSCVDALEGTACTSRETCRSLDCLDGTCQGSTEGSLAFCQSMHEEPAAPTSPTEWVATLSRSVPPPPAVYGASLVPSACGGSPAGGVDMIRFLAPLVPNMNLVASVEVKVQSPSTAELTIYQRSCGVGFGERAPITCATGAPLRIDPRGDFDVMIAARDANAEPIPYTVTITWTGFTE